MTDKNKLNKDEIVSLEKLKVFLKTDDDKVVLKFLLNDYQYVLMRFREFLDIDSGLNNNMYKIFENLLIEYRKVKKGISAEDLNSNNSIYTITKSEACLKRLERLNLVFKQHNGTYIPNPVLQ